MESEKQCSYLSYRSNYTVCAYFLSMQARVIDSMLATNGVLKKQWKGRLF